MVSRSRPIRGESECDLRPMRDSGQVTLSHILDAGTVLAGTENGLPGLGLDVSDTGLACHA